MLPPVDARGCRGLAATQGACLETGGGKEAGAGWLPAEWVGRVSTMEEDQRAEVKWDGERQGLACCAFLWGIFVFPVRSPKLSGDKYLAWHHTRKLWDS